MKYILQGISGSMKEANQVRLHSCDDLIRSPQFYLQSHSSLLLAGEKATQTAIPPTLGAQGKAFGKKNPSAETSEYFYVLQTSQTHQTRDMRLTNTCQTSSYMCIETADVSAIRTILLPSMTL
jgi:hypothetical protein